MVQHMKSGSLMIQILLSGECKSKIIYTMLRVIWLTLSKNVVHNVAKEKSTVELIKASFVYFLWSETKRSIKDGPSTLVDFVGWVASR